MDYVTSADGTQIAYHQIGSGRPAVVVGGALSTAVSAMPLAEAFLPRDYAESAGIGADAATAGTLHRTPRSGRSSTFAPSSRPWAVTRWCWVTPRAPSSPFLPRVPESR